MTLAHHLIEDAVGVALREDLGLTGDLTSNACIPESAHSTAAIVARNPGTIAGIALARDVFAQIDNNIKIEVFKEDGDRIAKGDVVMHIVGKSRGILTAERVALNFLGHLSGIATATSILVDAIAGTKAHIACTRKTTPGIRALEKHAVQCGGGINHRFGLFDAVMIKDNHIIAAGGIAAALQAVKTIIGHTVKIEIEVDTLDQLEEVLTEGTDIILLDNMPTDDLKKAVTLTKGRAILEASGNVTIETVRAIAETNVDIISSGWITHSAPTLDLGMDFS